MGINFTEILTAFMVLFAVIDITGSVPVIIDLRSKSKKVHAEKAAIISFLLMLVFLFVGGVGGSGEQAQAHCGEQSGTEDAFHGFLLEYSWRRRSRCPEREPAPTGCVWLSRVWVV